MPCPPLPSNARKTGASTSHQNPVKSSFEKYHIPDPRRGEPGPASLKLPQWRGGASSWLDRQILQDVLPELDENNEAFTEQEISDALQLFYIERRSKLHLEMGPGWYEPESLERRFLRMVMKEILEPDVYHLATELTGARRITPKRYNNAAANRQRPL